MKMLNQNQLSCFIRLMNNCCNSVDISTVFDGTCLALESILADKGVINIEAPNVTNITLKTFWSYRPYRFAQKILAFNEKVNLTDTHAQIVRPYPTTRLDYKKLSFITKCLIFLFNLPYRLVMFVKKCSFRRTNQTGVHQETPANKTFVNWCGFTIHKMPFEYTDDEIN